jgi:hypothetical protein
MKARRYFAGVIGLLYLLLGFPAGASADDQYGATPTGYFGGGRRLVTSSHSISYDLTQERAAARKNGVVVASNGALHRLPWVT